MTLQQGYKQLLAALYELYDDREAANIGDLVIEYVTGQNKLGRILNKTLPLTADQLQQLHGLQEQLLQHKPVQYVLNEGWFAGLKLFVNEHVLIPRPETEELVDWVVQDHRQNLPFNATANRILDVGTGSGCIALALKKELSAYEITAIDVSADALEVARKNAQDLKLELNFMQIDFLNIAQHTLLPTFETIVSNPPYIKQSEAASMSGNVLKYEPSIALFVPDDNALIFYDALAKFAHKHLTPEGSLYVEINEMLGGAVIDVFKQNGLHQTTLRQDFQGKDRMVKACR